MSVAKKKGLLMHLKNHKPENNRSFSRVPAQIFSIHFLPDLICLWSVHRGFSNAFLFS